MRGRLRRLRVRIGRRGTFLGFLAVLDVIFGYYLLNPIAGTPPQVYPLLPVQVVAAWWISTGAVCTVGMFLRVDRVAYALAALLKTGWALRYAYLWFQGISQAWVGLTVWLVFAFTVVVVSGWPEEVTLPPEALSAGGKKGRVG